MRGLLFYQTGDGPIRGARKRPFKDFLPLFGLYSFLRLVVFWFRVCCAILPNRGGPYRGVWEEAVLGFSGFVRLCLASSFLRIFFLGFAYDLLCYQEWEGSIRGAGKRPFWAILTLFGFAWLILILRSFGFRLRA